MLINSTQASGECDFCDKDGASVGALSQGATGRVCEVMWLCTPCAEKRQFGPILEAKDVRENIKQHFGEHATADF